MRGTAAYSGRGILLLLAVCGMAAGCCRRTAAPEPAFQPREFPAAPKVPALITDPAQAAEYVVTHYWDAFTDTSRIYPCDTALVNGVPREKVESAFGMYVTLLERQESLPFAQKAVDAFFSRIEAFEARDTATNVFEFLTKQFSRYLYDPNSPVRSEDLYLPFVSRMAVSDHVPADLHPAFAFDARMCALNRTGTPAADFAFRDLAGRTHRLYDIRADRTLLFFTNPGCPSCKEIVETIKADTELSRQIAAGRLAVVNIYIDRELDKWKEYAATYPADWYNGYDADYIIRSDVSYNVRAIPSLYLLDDHKTVLLKDAPPERVLDVLHRP